MWWVTLAILGLSDEDYDGVTYQIDYIQAGGSRRSDISTGKHPRRSSINSA